MNATIDLLRLALLTSAMLCLGWASINDLAARTIPDLSAFALLLIGLVLRLIDGTASVALALSATVFIFAALCWRSGWVGGGDVKLLAACAWMVPPPWVPDLLLAIGLAGGLIAVFYLILHRMTAACRLPRPAGRRRSLAVRVLRAERWRLMRRPSLPYGCAIAAGTLITLVHP